MSQPLSEVLETTKADAAKVTAMLKRKPGRPRVAIQKQQVKAMLTPETYEALKAAGRPGSILAGIAEKWAKSQ